MKSRRPWCLGLVCVLVASSLCAVSLAKDAKEPHLPTMRRHILEVHTARLIGRALDRAMKAIGHPKGFADHGAFAAWLQDLPDGRAKHPTVLQRIGWAFVRAKRGKDALEPLKTALADNPSSGTTRSYLAEAFRQVGRLEDAAEMFATAARAGYDKPHVQDGLVQTAIALRNLTNQKNTSGIPNYAEALGAYADAKMERGVVDHKVRAMAAQWILEDLKAYDKPTTKRGQLWAKIAAESAAYVAFRAETPVGGAAPLLRDAALALESQRDAHPTLYYDVVASAYKLGRRPDGGEHEAPLIMTMMAEELIRRGRYEEANHILQQRLTISECPRARRATRLLPPDLGDDDG